MTGIAPPTASPVERGLDEMSSRRVAALPAALPETAWDASRVPVAWLPALAWALSVDLWDPGWSAELQRAAIADAYAQHRLKGTPAGLKRALDHIGAVYNLVERPGDKAFTVSVEVLNLDAITLPSEAQMLALLGRVKRASVHLSVSAVSGTKVEIAIGIAAAAAAIAPATARLVIAEGAAPAADTTAPTVAISGVPAVALGPFVATFTFSEAVQGFELGDIAVGGTGGGAASAFAPVSATVYTAVITPAATGTVTVDVPPGVAVDGAGNGNTAAPQAASAYTRLLTATFELPAPSGSGFTMTWTNRQAGLGDVSAFRATAGAAHLITMKMNTGGVVARHAMQVFVGETIDGSSGATVGPELSAAWEGYARALTIRTPGLNDLVIAGPASPLVQSSDPTEPYVWRPGPASGAGLRYLGGGPPPALSDLRQWQADYRAAVAAAPATRATVILTAPA